MISLKEDLEEYAEKPVPPVSAILQELVGVYSVRIFSDPEKLRTAMRSRGAAEADICKVCLITGVTGFQAMIQPEKKLLQADLDHFVHNAVEETDLNRAVVLRLTAEIVGAAGKVQLCGSREQLEEVIQEETVLEKAVLEEHAFMIPVTLYEKELEDFQESFEDCRRRGSFASFDLRRITPLVAAGLPRAKYYMGCCQLHGEAEGHQQGAALLEEAARAGEVEAAAELGDYYFKCGPGEWSHAYSCYTGFGALALTPQRKDAVLKMLHQKQFNCRFLLLSALLFLLIAITIFFAPGRTVYSPHFLWGGVCAAGSLAVLLLAVRRFRKNPFGSFYFTPVAMLVLWSIHIAVRLLPV